MPLSKQRCKAPPAQISNNKLKPAHASFPFIFARKPATQACTQPLFLLASLAPTKLVVETSVKPAPICNTLLPVAFALCQSRLLANLPPLPELFISYPGRVPKPSRHTVTQTHKGLLQGSLPQRRALESSWPVVVHDQSLALLFLLGEIVRGLVGQLHWRRGTRR